MVSQRLINYIKEDLKGHDKEEIKKILVEQGYPEELADNAIKIAVKVNEQEKGAERREEREKQGIKELEEERESKKEQLKVKSEQTKKKLGELKKKTIEKARKNSKVLIFMVIVIILGASFFVFEDFFNDWFYNIKNERSLVLDLDFEDYYLINGNSTVIKDNSKYGNDGILKGDAKLVDTEFGKAVELSGSGYVEVNDNYILDISDEITIEAWVKVKSKTGSNMKIIQKEVDGGHNDPWQTYALMLEGPADSFGLHISTGIPGSLQTVTGTTHPILNKWYHVVGTYDGKTMRIYVNGMLENSISTSITMAISNQPLRIGKNGDGEYWEGVIDEVLIYNNALTEKEIKRSYLLLLEKYNAKI